MSDFRDEAPCRGWDTRVFFPSPGVTPPAPVVNVCRYHCPVQKQCLDYAIENNERGWWGGQSEKARKDIKRRIDRRRR